MNRTVKQIAGGTFIAIASLLIGFSAHEVSAATTWETSQPVQSVPLSAQYSTCCSYEDNYKDWSNYYRVPLGTTFSTIQLAIDVTSGSQIPVYAVLMQDNNGTLENSNTGDDATQGDTQVAFLGQSNAQQIAENLVQISVATTTITNSNYYVMLLLTPNGYTYTAETQRQFDSGTFTTCSVGSYGSTSCSTGDSIQDGAVALRLCNGACPTTPFSPVPNLTAEPWARMVSPQNNSQHTSTVSFTIQTNTGTSTADSVEVRFLSNYQSLLPETYDLNTTGLQTYTFSRNFPAINDTVQIEVHMLSGSTTIVTSPTYSIRIGDSLLGNPSVDDAQSCDDTSGIGWAICTTVVFLFVPSDNAIEDFSGLYATLSTKFPFAYFTDFNDSVSAVFTNPTTHAMALSVPFGPFGDIDLISAEQIEAVPLTSTIRTLLGALIWLMLGVTIYRRTYRIFNQQST